MGFAKNQRDNISGPVRQRFSASQAVFAAYLNTSISTVQKWEQGHKRPNGPSLKLLSLVDRKGLYILI